MQPFVVMKKVIVKSLILLICLTALISNVSYAQTCPSIKAKAKPDKEWKTYPTNTIESSKELACIAIDTNICTYGGDKNTSSKATGYFRVETSGGKFRMIDPDGHRFIVKGIVSVTPGNSKTTKNIISTLPKGEISWADDAAQLLQKNSFNSTGAWSDNDILNKAEHRVSYTIMVNFMSGYGKKRGGTFQQPGHTGYPNDCIFVFDKNFVKYCDEKASKFTEYANDKYLVGYFSDNEMPFKEDMLVNYLGLPVSDEGYIAADNWMRNRKSGDYKKNEITDTDKDAFMEYLSETYFGVTSAAIKKYDPNHLFLGSRFHGSALRLPGLFRGAGKFVDIFSINYYNVWTPVEESMNNWVKWSGKPFLITEWYVKAEDSGLPNYSGAGWIVGTQKDRGLFYQNFTLALLKNKGCLGWHWFKYMDNDPKGKGGDPSNEDSNKGIVKIDLTTYEDLMINMKSLNSRVYNLLNYFDKH